MLFGKRMTQIIRASAIEVNTLIEDTSIFRIIQSWYFNFTSGQWWSTLQPISLFSRMEKNSSRCAWGGTMSQTHCSAALYIAIHYISPINIYIYIYLCHYFNRFLRHFQVLHCWARGCRDASIVCDLCTSKQLRTAPEYQLSTVCIIIWIRGRKLE